MRFMPDYVLTRLCAAVVAMCTAIVPAAANMMDEIVVEGCTDVDLHPDPVAVIAPCTKLIESGALEGNRLAAALRHRGDAYFRTKQYDKAYAAYDFALRIQPLYPRALWNRANLHSVHGRYQAKINDLHRAYEIDPNDPLTLEAVGTVYARTGRRRKAIEFYSRALKSDPSMLRVMLNRARSYMVTNEFSLALSDLDHILKFSREKVSRHFIVQGEKDFDLYGKVLIERANVLLNMRRYDLAQRDLDHLVSLHPNLPNAYFNRASLWIVSNQPAKAVADLTRAIELDPRNTGSFRGRARAYRELDQYDKALEDLTIAVEIDPTDGRNHLHRAWLHNKMRQTDLALADYERAFTLDAYLLKDHLKVLKQRGYYSGPQLRSVNDKIRNGTIACIVDPRC